MSNNGNNSSNGSNVIWTSDLIAQTDFMVFRDISTDKITNVVAPNGLQVGLFDDDHTADLNVTGDITGSGEIYALENITANLGFTGSLQKLIDGTNYLRAGANVTVTNNADGSISLASNTSSTTANNLTAGTGLAFNAGSTFDGSAAKTLSIDINSQSAVTAATADYVLIHDATDGTLKKATVGTIQAAGTSLDISGLSSALSESTLASGDLLAAADINDSNEVKKITVEDFGQYLASGTNAGIGESGGKLTIDLNDLSAATVNVATDSLAIIDATDNTSKKESIADIVTGIKGTTASTALAASSGVLSVDITNMGTTTLASNDEVLVYDVDAAALKKATIADLSVGAAPVGAQYVVLASDGTLTNESVLTAGDGLDISGATFSVDLKSSGGLKIDSTELTVEPGDFAGAGLEDDGSDNLRIAAAAAGTGLTGGGGSALSVQYGTSAGNAAQGNTTFTLNAGDGLSGGGSAQPIGANIAYTLDVQAEDIAGTGLSVSNNNLNIYMGVGAGTTVTTGSEGDLIITPNVKEYHFNSPAAGFVTTTGSLSLAGNLGASHKSSDIGTDTFVYFSGSQGSKDGASPGATVFGGDVVISGTLHGGSPLRIGTEVIFLNSMEVQGPQTFTGRLTGQNSAGITGSFGVHDLVLHGRDETMCKGNDVAHWFSGSIGSKNTDTAGLALFGGDVVISGTLYGGSPLRMASDLVIGTSAIDGVNHSGSVSVAGDLGLDYAASQSGADVFFFVSGSKGSLRNGAFGTSLFGGDIYISGSIVSNSGISGSLTHLADGTSYLIAGNNITISTGSTGAITVSSEAGASITASSGSTTVSELSTIKFGPGFIMNTEGSVTAAITASIGEAEDSSYSDGLFTDFVAATPIGTAIDRFNEVLKGLAPSAAPQLDDIDCDDTGTSAKLSFGNSQSVTGYTSARPSTLSPSSGLSDIDINGAYSTAAASNDLRRACFGAITEINGTLNEDVSADGLNYVADSFGDGNQGTLKLYVNNNSTVIHSTDLSSFVSGNSLNGNGSGFNVSVTTPGHFADSSDFATFQHRQGTYKIVAADQRNGWNYARVVHTIGSADRVCNYIEWINDPTGAGIAMSTSADSLASLSMSGTKYLSGVKYHTGGSASYGITIANAYRNVYSANQITFGGSNTSTPAQSIPSINYGGGEDETKTIVLSGITATINTDPILNGSISVNTNVPHPLKSNLSGAGSQSISGILLYNLSDTASVISEPMRGESYRMKNSAYNAQSDVAGSNLWDSTDSLLSVDGLLVYNQTLISPSRGANSGNFSGITNGPGSNVNYSSITSGTRTYFRKFTNNSGGSKTNFNLTVNGSGTIVNSGGTLNSSNIKIFCKLPNNGSFSTGWMDLATAFSTGQVSDNNGCLVGSLDSSLNATNQVTFGTQSAGSNEYVIIKVLADASWTGNISQISISWL
tara:strand:+ start:9901 stop:14181 length:4281 start_codon:yes stop_codon:yes gene_type:complete